MSISLVQTFTTRITNAPMTITGITSGNCIIFSENDSNIVTSISDSTGDTWTHYTAADSTAQPSGNWQGQFWYNNNASAGSHILTFTAVSPATNGGITVFELSGVSSGNPFYGGNAINDANFGTNVGPTLNVLTVGDMAVTNALPAFNSGATAPWTNIGTQGTSGVQDIAYYIPGSTGNVSVTFAAQFANSSGAVIKAFTAPPPTTQTTMFLVME